MNYLKSGCANLVISLALVVTATWSCRNDGIHKHLNYLHSIDSQIPKNDWKVLQFIDDNEGWGKEYLVKANNKDTGVVVKFTYIGDTKSDAYFLTKHLKQYFHNGYYWEVSLKNGDTLYFYRNKDEIYNQRPEKPISPETNIFIVGKYYFDWVRGRMKYGQRLYFEKHRDSLIKVRGNNLPPLPELE